MGEEVVLVGVDLSLLIVLIEMVLMFKFVDYLRMLVSVVEGLVLYDVVFYLCDLVVVFYSYYVVECVLG